MTKTSLLPILLLLVVCISLSACTREPTRVLPTQIVLPSVTPSNTPSITPSPIPTDTPSPTLTPSLTPSPTDTFTPTTVPSLTPSTTLTPSLTPSNTPTRTFTPSDTPTPTDTYTPTPTSTFTPSDTPTPTSTYTPSDTPTTTATNTPLPTVALPTAQIFSFGANQMSAAPNAPLTVAWTTNADTVRLEAISELGAVVQSQIVPTSGQTTVLVTGSPGHKLTFRLVASRNGNPTTRSFEITIICAGGWFFGNQYAPPNAGCPASLTTSDGRYQTFERGIMIYVSANGFNHVYGLLYDGARYQGYVNGWDGMTQTRAIVPDGRFPPEEMFNWAYYNTSAPGGNWSDALGWATSAILNAPRTIQWENALGALNPFYIDAPDGGVYRFSGGESGTWGRLR